MSEMCPLLSVSGTSFLSMSCICLRFQIAPHTYCMFVTVTVFLRMNKIILKKNKKTRQ